MFDSVAKKFVENRARVRLKRLVPLLIDEGVLPSSASSLHSGEAVLRVLRNDDSERLIAFDTECIGHDDDYANLFLDLAAHAGLSNSLAEVRSKFDDQGKSVTLTARVNDELVSSSWAQRDDYVTPDFFEFVADIFRERLSTHMIALPAEDQCAELLFVKNSLVASELQAALNQVGGNFEAEDITGYEYALIAAVALVGCATTSALGSLFGSSVFAVVGSLIVWSLFAVWQCVGTTDRIRNDLELRLAQQPRKLRELTIEFMSENKDLKA